MARIRLVHGDDGNPRGVMRTQPIFTLLGRHPVFDGRQHQLALQVLAERIDRLKRAERRGASHGRRRIDGDDALARRQSHDPVLDHERLGGIDLGLIRLLDAVRARMIVLDLFVHLGPMLGAGLNTLRDLLRQRFGLLKRLLATRQDRVGIGIHHPAVL